MRQQAPPQARGGGWQRQQQPQQRPQPQQIRRGWERRQQAPQIVRQAPEIFRQEPRGRGRQEAPRQVFRQPQPQVYAPMIRPDRGNGRGNGRGRGVDQAGNWMRANGQGQNWGGGGNGRQRQEDRRGNAFQRVERGQNPWMMGRVPPGQIRSAEVHERNAERKAEREATRGFGYQPYYQQPYYQQPYYSGRDYRRQFEYRRDYGYYQGYQSQYDYVTPVYPYASPVIVEQYYSTPYYGGGLIDYSPLYVPNFYAYAPYSAYDQYSYQYWPDNYGDYGYDNYSGALDWKSMLLRTLVSFVLGGRGNDYYGAQPYDAYYSYQPNIYGPDMYSQYAGYYPDQYVSPAYYSDTSYSYTTYDDPFINTIPVTDLYAPSYCGYSSSLLKEVLAQGYEQGYYYGRYEQRDRDRRQYLNDLYASYDEPYYDPYSQTISENRRVFAEGYAMGYRDAISGRRENYYVSARDTDLVSLLMSNMVGVY